MAGLGKVSMTLSLTPFSAAAAAALVGMQVMAVLAHSEVLTQEVGVE
jgi:hypothetical protein